MHAEAMLEAKRLMSRAAEAALRGEPGAAAMADLALTQHRRAQDLEKPAIDSASIPFKIFHDVGVRSDAE